MGIGDAINSGLGRVGDVVDAGKKLVGEGVDKGTDVAGDALDKVGAHGLANRVEKAGDRIASDLGATPGEQQLGQSEQPENLVHGDAKAIRAAAGHLTGFFTAFDRVGDGMRRLDSSSWQGEAAETFREKFAMHPTKWLQAADACDTAGKALSSYADTVQWAQGQAQDAITLYQSGKKVSEQAVEAYDKKVDAYNAAIKADQDPGPPPEQFKDPGRSDIARAQEILDEARRQRNDAGRMAAGAVRKALAHAPAEPPPLAQLKADAVDGYQAVNTEVLHFGGGVVKGTAGILNFARGLNPMDPYNLTHPAAYVQNVNMTLAGLISTGAHPERAAKVMLDDFKKDPSEGLGRLLPNLVGDGAGLEAGLARLTAKEGLEGVAEQTVLKEGTGVAEKSAADTAKSNPEKYDTPNPGEKVKDDPSDPIDLTTGRMYLPQTDLALPGALPLVFKRRVESGYRFGRWFGPSWSSTIDQRLEIDSEGVVLVTEDGLLLVYPHPAPGLPTLPSHGPRWPLDREDGGYTITDPRTRRVWHFTDRTENLAVLEQIDDRNGNWITFEYDAEGTPLGIASSAGYDVRISTEAGRVTALSLVAAEQVLVRYGYADGQLAEVVNSSGIPLRFTYDEAGRVTSWTDTNNRGYTYEYDDQDRCIAQGGSHGHMTLRLSYEEMDPDTGLRVTTATTGGGHTRRYAVNKACQVVAETDPLGAVTRFQRDRYHRLLSHTDALGLRTTFRYDEEGNLLAATRPDGREARAEYNELGLPVKVVNPDGTVVRQSYDDRGNRTSVTTPSGQTTRFTYNEAGHLASVTDPLGHTTTVVCDCAGLPLEITDPLGSVTRYERDAFGRPVAITDPTGSTAHLEWTVEGRLARRTAADGATESWTYDGEGNCTSHTDPMGGVSRFEYTHFDLLTARTGPDGVRYEFDHDMELRLAKVTNPQGLTWTYEYDAAGRLVTETDFDDRALSYVYDTANRVVSRSNALGEVVTFERDELGRAVRKDAAGLVTTYTYDLTDQLAQSTGPDGTVLTLLRDRFGRVRSETIDGRTQTYTYDESGRRNGRTTPTGATTTWAYDAAGRRTGMVASGRAIDFIYDTVGRELTCRVGEMVTLEHEFDALGRLTTQGVTGAQGRIVQSRTYTYRADGNLISIDDQLSGSRRFDLDVAGRVTAVRAVNWTEEYAYDAAGNQTQASWPSSHPGGEAVGAREYTGTRITRAGKVRYEHDALGRITLRH
nr:DUF6531 domain-containing protein [Streptomyces sp. NBC_00886]